MFARSTCAVVVFVLAVELHGSNLPASGPQYTRTVWTQAQGLPQDSVSTIAQTPDGYLWLGTREGLVRFDGYDFVTRTKSQEGLPGNSILSLHAGRSGTLWIGTNEGLASYKDGHFRTHGRAEGVPASSVTSLAEDTDGSLWLVVVGTLMHLRNGKVQTIPSSDLASVTSPRRVYIDPEETLWVAGVGGVARRTEEGFIPVLGAKELGEILIVAIRNTKDGLWLGSVNGLVLYKPDHTLIRYSTKQGLPDNHIRELAVDHDDNIWVATYSGLSRFHNGRFSTPPSGGPEYRGTVWAIMEDRERNIWAGTQGALYRLRDAPFVTYGTPEGFPSNAPMAVHEDSQGRIWIGYRDGGLVQFRPGDLRPITTREGLPSNEIHRIREGPNGELLLVGAGGLSRFYQGRIMTYTLSDPAGRSILSDALIDSRGELWVAAPSGVFRYRHDTWQPAIPSGTDPTHVALVLSEAPDHSVWAGTYLGALWRIDGEDARLVKEYDDGLGASQIRSLSWDSEKTLWIGSFDGGLTRYRDGVFHRFHASDGLLSDNIAHVNDDQQGNLWLSTTKGICRVSKQQLDDLAAGRIKRLTPTNYGTGQGLRSTQMAQSYPAGGGGTRGRDGRLWFTSANGVVVVNPVDLVEEHHTVPMTHITGVVVDGHSLTSETLDPSARRIEFNFVGIQLSAPESLQYSYKLEGLEPEWSPAGAERQVSYNNLTRGDYRFWVKAIDPGGRTSTAQYAFTVSPHIYETPLFLMLASLLAAFALYGGYRLRLAQVQARFGIVVAERARLAREIHDTLAQGFVGISHQLDTLASRLDDDPAVVREQLDLARRMTRHSLTEARRSIMDLRLTELQEQKLPQALSMAAPRWIAGQPVRVELDVEGFDLELPVDLEQNLFRIAQESFANAIKHARPNTVRLMLRSAGGAVLLTIVDDGVGFDTSKTFANLGGHLGIIGMRERAGRFGGTLHVISEVGAGTRVEVRIPHATNKSSK